MTGESPPDSGRNLSRARRGRVAQRRGLACEAAVAAALAAEGWQLRGWRLRTPAGEIDLVCERDGLLALVEVKSRATLAGAAAALSERQKGRLLAAAEFLLGEHPEWGRAGVRFDLLAVDAAGEMRRIADAFRLEQT